MKPYGFSDDVPQRMNDPLNSDVRIERSRVFESTDWLSFTLVTIVTLVVYLWTLAPNVTLEFSGILCAGAMYCGVPHPPGYPLWTIYAWLSTVLLPFSNIAWRVAVSSAVAASLASGLVALIASRGSATMIDGISPLQRLTHKEASALRIVSGIVSGSALAFDGGFWCRAVVVDTWPFSVLLFCTVVCLLTRWFYRPDQWRHLYGAFFVYGLALSNSQALATGGLGLQLLITFGNPKLGRDLFFTNTLFIAAVLAGIHAGCWDTISLEVIYLWIGITSTMLCIALTIKTQGFLTEWKTLLVLGTSFLVGLAMYLYVPLASMSNPPVNWGYPRTVTGFIHTVTRGQYERIYPTDSFRRSLEQMHLYGEVAVKHFGIIYIALALVPFCLLHRMPLRTRSWMLGLAALYLSFTLLLLVTLNPSSDMQSQDVSKVFFSASHLVIAICSGCGVTLVAALLNSHQRETRLR